MEHFVSQQPFDPNQSLGDDTRMAAASQRQLIWRRFKRHKLAVFSMGVLAFTFLVCIFAEIFAPYGLHTRHTDYIYAPPQALHLVFRDDVAGLATYGLDYSLNMETFKREYTENPNMVGAVRFFCRGDRYRFWGLFEADVHLICPPEHGTLFLLGTDRLGRDLLSRIIYGARVSMTIGLLGIALAFLLGIVIGGAAGYFGGWVDWLVMRVIEIMRAFPTLPLLMTLSAILPITWSPLLVFFGITLILALLDWTGLARAVRSKLLALREEDYCQAAELMGARPRRVIFKHLMPGFMSHLIASASLAIPEMILSETALSFLGLGLRPPITSWGVLLNEAQNINAVALYPWLMLPVVPVIVVILAYNFMGDGLRDAADPYKH